MNIDCNIVRVNLAQSSYFIYIGHSIVSQKALWKTLITGSHIYIVTNETIAPLYLSQLTSVFSEFQCDTIILPDGEAHKSFEHWQKILDGLIENYHNRNTTLIALGGGVIGDITGFAAACYQRGVNFIQVPTTLLAQVDASVGGKTAINYQRQKNLIGAFHQPKAVIIDTNFLTTLSEREFCAGLAEVIKCALIYDKRFFEYLCDHVDEILARSTDVLEYIIEMSIKIKIHFVELDERDETGVRAFLNFGHTFGHALESAMDYNILHGEAVAWGMRQACHLSRRLGYLSQADVSRVEKLLEQCELLISLPGSIKTDELIHLMTKDKKNRAQTITFVLLKNLGEAFVADKISSEIIFE